MARTYKRTTDRRNNEERQLSARLLRRSPIGFEQLTQAFTGIALARIEREAQADHERQLKSPGRKEATHEAEA